MNIRSIHKNFDVFKTFLNSLPKPPAVIALTETWLRESFKHLYSLDGYVSHNLVRTNREHGGITIFIKDIFSFELINEYCFINDNIEICTARLKILNYSYIISVIHRLHSKHVVVNEFTTIANQILSNEIFRCSKTILLGDLNINLLEHSTHWQLIKDAKANYYYQFFFPISEIILRKYGKNEIRNKSKLKHSITILHHNNLILDKPLDIAQVFNDYFCSIALELSDRIPVTNEPNSISKKQFSKFYVIACNIYLWCNKYSKIIKNKNSNTSEISVSVLKHNCDIFSTPLTFLFNQSITTGTLPSILKKQKSL